LVRESSSLEQEECGDLLCCVDASREEQRCEEEVE
jgi:hypothetical protein